MRSSNMMKNLTTLALMALMVGCAAPLTNLQRAEQQYTTAEEQRKQEEAEAQAAQAEAAQATQKEAEAGRGLAQALVTDADEQVRYVEQQLARAEAQRKKACELNPELDFCKKAAPPSPELPPAQKAGDPPPQAAPPLSYVDIKVNDFNLTGLERLIDYPSGWKVTFDSDKGEVTLMIEGKRAYGYSKPANFKAGVCYRFGATAATLCPATPPSGPAAAPLPGP